MSTEQRNEEYVLVPKSKHRLTRARKFVIGFMAIGAVAAVAGAGTFASFSASTTNDATFKTGTLILSDKVASGNTCFSSKADNSNSPADDATLDVNDTTCDALFSSNLLPNPATGGTNFYTALLTIRNEGTTTGTLKSFAPAVCTNGAASAATNEIERISVGGATGGTFTVTYAAQTSAAIAYNASAGTAQTALEGVSTIGVGNVTVTKDGTDFLIAFIGTLGGTNITQVTRTDSTTGGTGVVVSTVANGGGSIPAGSGATLGNTTASGPCGRIKFQVQETSDAAGTTALPSCVYPNDTNACGTNYGSLKDFYTFADANSALGSMAAGATRFFTIKIQLPTGITATTGTCESAATSTGAYEYNTGTGVGCDNYLMNTKATLNVRWQIQG